MRRRPHNVALAAMVLVMTGCASSATPPAASPRPAPTGLSDPFSGMRQRTEVVMGTRLTIAVPKDEDAVRRLAESFTIARRWDRVLSGYIPDSELNGLLASKEEAPLVSAALARFLALSQRLCKQTAGAFDISLGGGCESYELVGQRFRWGGARRRLDAGGIGKGIAVDEIIAGLRRSGVERAFINFGGSSFFGLGGPWRIGVTSHTSASGPLSVVTLRGQGLSTSKSQNPRGVAHIIDPRSGRPIRAPRLATAEGPSAAIAEALSTALVVSPGSLRRWRGTFPRYELTVHPGR